MKLISYTLRFTTKLQLMKCLKFLVLSLVSVTTMMAQDNDQLKKDIYFYADIVANAMDYDHKVRANNALVPLIENALENKLDIDLKSLNWISNISSPDSLFSIISWPIQTSESSHSYAGYIILDDKIIKLHDESLSMLDNIDYVIGDKDNWFGQMYYNIKEFEDNGITKYILFGKNSYTQYEDIKMAELVYFDETGEVVFGEQKFAKDASDLRDAKNRIVLKYSDDAPINLNYNPGLEMIVYDHLVPRMGQLSGQGIILTGDGSYEGYSLNENLWLHKDKLFDHIYEEAPRPTPVLDSEKSGKDLFGKPKKDKNK